MNPEQMNRKIYFMLVFLYLSLCAINNSNAQEGKLNIRIDIKNTYQTIDNFGASDCWSVQFVGNWPDAKRNAMADLLFSQELDSSGKPKGIGLSIWRFNIGGGSTEQGEASGISTDWRRAECFKNPDGTYNWNKQAGQQWFLKAAKQRGVEQFLGFTNTPPVHITQNGLGFNKGRSETLNLKPDKYEAYADFLAQVVIGLQNKTGVRFNYISPFNEPEWDWRGNSQEGTPALNYEIANGVKALDKKLTENNLDTKIVVTESGKLDYLYKAGTDKPGRDNQIQDLFSPASANYIGNLAHVPAFIGGHAYWTINSVSEMVQKRKELHETLTKQSLGYWQTEVCMLGEAPDIGKGGGRDLTMKTALFFARVIHHDMVVSNASAWQWWLAISYVDFKDGLIYVFPNSDKSDGTFTDSKLLWSLGNYSRFIRPGAVRVDASGGDINNPEGLMVSAYHIAKDKQVVVVAVNYGTSGKKFRLNIPGVKIIKAIPYITSDKEGENLLPGTPLEKSLEAEILPRSVVTFVCNYKT